jgi:hypothetical protein
MITPERREILQLLGPLSELAGDMRFGQLVCNLVTLAGRMDAEAIWDIEDEELLVGLRKFTEDLKRREANKAVETASV